jgi:hypothetical protein
VVPNQSIKYVSGLTPLHQTAFPLHTLAAVRTGPNRPMLVYMVSKSTLNGIWREAPADDRDFDPEALSPHLPGIARSYLTHAIAPGTRLASAVRLSMHGEIRLKQWLPFVAEQVIRPDRGMIWQARVRMSGLLITGFDRLIDGVAQMRWRLLGLVPLVRAQGPDITRSATGRLAAETIWLPSFLCSDLVHWQDRDTEATTARFRVAGETMEIELRVGEDGRLRSVRMQRWGNPEGNAFHSVDFGAHVEDEAVFGGYAIPTRLHAGWHIREQGFAADGEFFRVTIDAADFR